jgi:hypothetical protein
MGSEDPKYFDWCFSAVISAGVRLPQWVAKTPNTSTDSSVPFGQLAVTMGSEDPKYFD